MITVSNFINFLTKHNDRSHCCSFHLATSEINMLFQWLLAITSPDSWCISGATGGKIITMISLSVSDCSRAILISQANLKAANLWVLSPIIRFSERYK